VVWSMSSPGPVRKQIKQAVTLLDTVILSIKQFFYVILSVKQICTPSVRQSYYHTQQDNFGNLFIILEICLTH